MKTPRLKHRKEIKTKTRERRDSYTEKEVLTSKNHNMGTPRFKHRKRSTHMGHSQEICNSWIGVLEKNNFAETNISMFLRSSNSKY